MKVSIILKGKPDQFDRLPICLRINEGEKRSYKTTSFRASKADFKKGLPQAVNDQLKALVLKTEMDLLQGKTKYKDMEFFAYTDRCMKEWDKIREYGTMKKYRSEIGKLKAWRASFKLSQVDPEFLRDYSLRCYENGNAPNTVWTTFRIIRTIILKAKRERLIEHNPFDIFKMPKYRDPQVRFLTKEEVDKWAKHIPKSGNNRMFATWFLIGCYTALRYGDMNKFDKQKHIRGGRLVLYTSKTGEVVSMPLKPMVKKLFESIGYQPLFVSNQKYNSALDKIAEKVKLDGINGHTSRHTFGTMCAAAGISIEVTAKLMGHRDIKTTEIYYKLASPRIDKELDKLYK